MRFYNWQEMYDILAAGTELYNPKLEKHVRCEKGKKTLLISDVKKEKIVDYIHAVHTEDHKNTEEKITKTITPAEEYCKAYYKETGWTNTALIK